MKKIITVVIAVLSAIAVALSEYFGANTSGTETRQEPETEIVMGTDDGEDGETEDGTYDETEGESEATDATDVSDADALLPAMPTKWDSKVKNVVRHKYFSLLYDTRHNTPAWVAWKLTAEHSHGNQERSQKFWADPKIPRQYRVDFYDYRAEWDRGHMCPAGDNKWDQEAMYECFYMSNMCPQDHILNTESWEKLESACRRWARAEGEIYIVCGPIYENRRHRQIGVNHKVDVPEGFFKAVVSLRKGKEKAIAFYFTNDAREQPYRDIATTVDEIEKKCGFNLFAGIDKTLQDRIEATADIKAWKNE